ncbi:MAG: hypothetical protein WBN70_01140, partial [Polyangiales bacterium]
MGTRAWLVALLALTLSCEGAEIGDSARTEPPRDLSTGGTTGGGGNTSNGGTRDAGTDADAGT